MDYYNDSDPGAVAWLKRLELAGRIPAGYIDGRDIRQIRGGWTIGMRRCQFFAGIGGWAYALELAGWPDDEPVWTGSCPCQPFSISGKRRGDADERHLWPVWFQLIAECRPPVLLGEQVASPDGREWLAGVQADLEGVGYRFAGADLCAAGVAAPHLRQRLYWVADTERERAGTGESRVEGSQGGGRDRPPVNGEVGHGLGDTIGTGLEERSGHQDGRGAVRVKGPAAVAPGPWDSFGIVSFQDGKLRRAQPGTFPLADGISRRVVKLRGYGNAIVPQLAAEFVLAYREARKEARES